jgi:hypothetical protein
MKPQPILVTQLVVHIQLLVRGFCQRLMIRDPFYLTKKLVINSNWKKKKKVFANCGLG